MLAITIIPNEHLQSLIVDAAIGPEHSSKLWELLDNIIGKCWERNHPECSAHCLSLDEHVHWMAVKLPVKDWRSERVTRVKDQRSTQEIKD